MSPMELMGMGLAILFCVALAAVVSAGAIFILVFAAARIVEAWSDFRSEVDDL